MGDKYEFYTYKGNIYKKIDEITTKHPVTREWIPFVLYMNDKGQLFSREIGEFYDLFSEVKNNPLAFAEFEMRFNHGFEFRHGERY